MASKLTSVVHVEMVLQVKENYQLIFVNIQVLKSSNISDLYQMVFAGARPFVCPICNHGFTTSSSLTKHKRIHSGEKPYECDVCKMKFSRSGILARHKRTHTGEKPYVCKFCTKAFSQSNDLTSHLRIHTGEKPYICDVCGQAFRQSSALKTHKKTHIDRNPILDTKPLIGVLHAPFYNVNSIMNANTDEGASQRVALQQSQNKFIVADHHKLDHDDFYDFYDLSDLDGLITDSSIDSDMLKHYEKITNVYVSKKIKEKE